MESREHSTQPIAQEPPFASSRAEKLGWTPREAATWLISWAGQPKHGRSLGRAVVVVLVVLSFGVLTVGIYHDLTRHTLQGTTPMSMDQNLVVTGASPDAQEAGFQVGDRFSHLGGMEVATLLEYRKAINRLRSDAWTDTTLVRDGESVRVPAFVSTQPVDMAFVVLYLTAAAFLALGALVGWQRA